MIFVTISGVANYQPQRRKGRKGVQKSFVFFCALRILCRYFLSNSPTAVTKVSTSACVLYPCTEMRMK